MGVRAIRSDVNTMICCMEIPQSAPNGTHSSKAEMSSYMSLVTLTAKCQPSICELGHGFETSNPVIGLFPVAFGWARFASQDSRSNCTALPATIVPPIGQPGRPQTPGDSNTTDQYANSFIVVVFSWRGIVIPYNDPFQVAMPPIESSAQVGSLFESTHLRLLKCFRL